MTHVFLHTRSAGKMDWTNEPRDFSRLPIAGEYVAPGVTSSWYLVELVVHCPFKADFEAEVFAVEVDHMKVKREAFKG